VTWRECQIVANNGMIQRCATIAYTHLNEMVISTINLFIYLCFLFLLCYAIALAGRLWFLTMEPQVQTHETSCEIHDGQKYIFLF
jgi:hypothetical protein